MGAGELAAVAEEFPLLAEYVELLHTTGKAWGLVGPNEDRPRLWERHVLNSLALEPLLPQAEIIVDVGSGAGLPGIPLAIVRADLQVTLLEPKQRSVDFLEQTAAQFKLSNVNVVRARAEEHSSRYSVVASRAVAPLSKLLHMCFPLLAPGGRLLAMKGKSVYEEVEAAASTLAKLNATAQVHELAIPYLDASTWCVEVSLGACHTPSG
ncbi:MAG: 16S rRNA (guanine(527)-N(7))-methyltransferase RsmG [Propionibacteriaceae bacterium]|nr:16S rRNA (guanine(527)-N(7))-methyltransferase RsmG [Propionibacteriaceae bacterium]